MKNLIAITIVGILLFSSCAKDKKVSLKTNAEKSKTQVKNDSKGYELMKNNCFVCHFPKPDPSKHDQMIAPPMLKVQEHYKPNYPKKDEFITAIKTWVNNPTKDKVLMPGAVRKFNLMPKLAVSEADLQLIAETLYDYDFGTSPIKMNKNEQLQLNNGKKWKLNAAAKNNTIALHKKLNAFTSKDLKAYQNFGSEVFDTAKNILLDKSIPEKTIAQLQVFFHNVEGNMHELIKAPSIEKSQEQQQILKKKFDNFFNFFE